MGKPELDYLQIDRWMIAATQDELAVFTVPSMSREEEQRLLEDFRLETLVRHRIALVIGRFQPLHYGHLFLMKQALQVADFIVIGIGSSNVRNAENPWSIQHRETMLKNALKKEPAIRKNVLDIVHIPDFTDDNLWLSETLKKTGEIDLIVGNNDWVNSIFTRAGYPVIETPLYHRNKYKGEKIRAQLRGARAMSC